MSISADVDSDNRESDRRDEALDRRRHFHNLFSPNDNFLYEVFMWLIDNVEGEWTASPNENEGEDTRVTCQTQFDRKDDLKYLSFG